MFLKIPTHTPATLLQLPALLLVASLSAAVLGSWWVVVEIGPHLYIVLH